MQTFILYLAPALIWGSCWYAIKFQFGIVTPDVSIGYRFILASLTLFFWCWIRGLNLRFSLKNHIFLLMQGMFMFSLNYLCTYWATSFLAGGLNAVVFSTLMIFNIMNSSVFYRTPITSSIILGGVLGICGLCTVFWPHLCTLDYSSKSVVGMALSLGGAAIASWGNMISTHNQKNQLPIIESNAYAMGYGAIFTLFVAILQGSPLAFEWSVPYVSSLVYLSLFGSVIAFGCYLTLLGKIGASRAAYVVLLSPIVALTISTIFEDFNWTYNTVVGVALILLGNVVVLMRGNLAKIRSFFALGENQKEVAQVLKV